MAVLCVSVVIIITIMVCDLLQKCGRFSVCLAVATTIMFGGDVVPDSIVVVVVVVAVVVAVTSRFIGELSLIICF